MAVFTAGWPATEGVVLKPASSGAWPLATQVLIMPWSTAFDSALVDTLQVMIVPRAEWERLSALREGD